MLITGGLLLVGLLWKLYQWERRELSKTEAGASDRPAHAHLARRGHHASRAGARFDPARDDSVALDDRRRRFREHEVFRSLHRQFARGRPGREPEARDRGGQITGRPAARDARGSTWSRRCSARNLEALARGRELFVYNLESAAQPGGGVSAQTRKLDDIQANRARIRRWAMPCTVCWRPTAASRLPA